MRKSTDSSHIFEVFGFFFLAPRPGPSAGEWPEASGGSSVQSLAWRIGGCMHG